MADENRQILRDLAIVKLYVLDSRAILVSPRFPPATLLPTR